MIGGIVVLCLSGNVAFADLATGRQKWLTGDYKAAIAELAPITGKDRSAAQLFVARAYVAVGDSAAGEKIVTAMAQRNDVQAIEAGLVLAEIRGATGRRSEARKQLEQLLVEHPHDRAVRTALAKLRYAQGEIAGGNALFDLTIAEFDRKALDLGDAEQLYQLADAARYRGQYELANDSYRAALKLRPQMTEAGIAWADLFARKYASELAGQTLDEVFKINPNHPDAHAAMADLIANTSYDLAAIEHQLGAAFAINPHHARALRVRALLAIDRNQWDAANQVLQQVLAANREDAEAVALQATVAWLRGDMKAYTVLRDRAFAINPGYAELYRIVARSAIREHRYAEAIDLERQALKIKPDFYEAMASVGLGYLRLGLEKQGLEWLDKAYRGDAYNVRTVNTLNLFERTIPKEYVFHETENFRIRYHSQERPALARYLEPTLERAFADMVKRYGFTPKTPVIVELYSDKVDYAVRAAGLPDIAALGVCFGPVIAAMSPATGDLNWGMVLWHELSHVFAIQLSNSRVPRWFTEGLSEYETLLARPEWRRENDADVYGALMNGTLPSIADLNSEFMQPDSSAVVVAYFLSAVAVEWIARTRGFDKIVLALKLYGDGKETPEVLKQITGKTVVELDREFRTYLGARLAPYAGTFKLPTRGFDDLTKLEIAADAAPKNALAKAKLALGYTYGGDAEKAEAAARQALQLDAKQPIARYILAEIAVHNGDAAQGVRLYRGLIATGHDSYDVRIRLAQLAQDAGEASEAEQQLCAAKKLDPERSYPYQALSLLYAKAGKPAKALAELEHYVFLEQMELAPLKELVGDYAQLGNWGKVRTYGEMATYVNPQDADVLLKLGRAYLELGDAATALHTYDTLLVAQPAPRRPALVHLGRAKALAALGNKRDAALAIDLAMKTEPENAEVLAVKAQLRK